MKNEWLNKIKTTYYIKIKGKNIERFIKRLNSVGIELLEIKYLKYNEIIIKIYKKNLEKIEEIKTIYDIEIVSYKGFYKYKELLKENKLIVITIILSFSFIWYLSNTIFYIDIIHNDSTIRNLIKEELNENGIRIYSLKKDYNYINKVKNKIMEKHKDKIEWLEIETVGVKYVVRVQLREHADIKDVSNNRDVVAKKDATIKKIIASSGQIVKEINTYVKKGDTIISGTITLNDNIKGYAVADGKIFGEVWYNITVEYPFTYYEEKYTGKKNNSLVFKFLNWQISIPKLKTYKVDKEYSIIDNRLIPLKLSFLKTRDIQVIDQVLTEDEAINNAIKLARSQMEKNLNDEEYIISQKNLNINVKDSKVVLESFFAVYENITDYKEIIIEDNEEKVE